jgi:1-acyl-sn-glycerol-3-phosphate acyltransferase
VGLAYLHGDGRALLGEAHRHAAPVYAGDTSLFASMWQTAGAIDLQATLHWGEPDRAQGRDRRTWAEALRTEVARLADQPVMGV